MEDTKKEDLFEQVGGARGRDPFLDARPQQPFPPMMEFPHEGPTMQPPYLPDPFSVMPQKSKVFAGVLAFFVPGLGHFYLGLMQKGIFIMMLFILNIAAIPYTVNNASPNANTYVPFIVLLGCLLPVIYFYNLFDALQSTDQVNAYRKAVQLGQVPPPAMGTDPMGRAGRGNYLGLFLIAIGLFLFLISRKPDWLDDLFHMMGSYVGAVLLVGIGFMLFVTESRKR